MFVHRVFGALLIYLLASLHAKKVGTYLSGHPSVHVRILFRISETAGQIALKFDV